jgi:hypothetical protein
MRRVIYSISSAAIICMAACATSNAAPIAPIPTATVLNAGNLIQVGYLLSWAVLSVSAACALLSSRLLCTGSHL